MSNELTGRNVGKTCRVHYKGTFNDGMLKERVAHEPVREVELRLSSPSAPARMMKILEAEGGAEGVARLASPHHQTGGHRLG